MDLATIRAAAERIRPYVHETPVMTSRFFDALAQARVFFKCENFQRVGAFKARGAFNAVLQLDDQARRRGVVTHSSGNHGQALACAAGTLGVQAFVVMPRTAPAVKQAAVRGYGAEVILCEPTLEAREAAAVAVIERQGAVLVHPYDQAEIIAGQGTAALELLAQAGPLDVVIAPVGGGGLLSGTATVVRELLPQARVLGAEPRNADDASRSLKSGQWQPSVAPKTIADGLLTSLGKLTWPIVKERVHDIVTLSEEAILEALQNVWQRMKIVIEPSSAVPVAALTAAPHEFRGRRVGVILSGGNVALALGK